MNPTYWQKQATDQPLFPDLLWSRPENRRAAGKLLVIGGNAHGFAAPAEGYSISSKAGVGTARVLLPDVLQKTVGALFPAAEFAPSNPSGGFARQALANWVEQAAWADGVLLAGDLGRNAETAITIESFANTYTGQLTITKDAADYALQLPTITQRPNTTLVISFAQLQKLATLHKFTRAFTFDMDLLRFIELLHEFTGSTPLNIITKHLDKLFVATPQQVSTTACPGEERIWRLKTAAYASVWWLQQPQKPFEALTTAALEACKDSRA